MSDLIPKGADLSIPIERSSILRVSLRVTGVLQDAEAGFLVRGSDTLGGLMDPSRKRTIRLVVALVCALGFASVLVYTSFSAGSQAKTPTELIRSSVPGRSYQLTGKVVPGSIAHEKGGALLFKVRDRVGTASVPIVYTGQVPDPFRANREVIVTVRKGKSAFVGERDSLQTKCPSKFKAETKGA